MTIYLHNNTQRFPDSVKARMHRALSAAMKEFWFQSLHLELGHIERDLIAATKDKTTLHIVNSLRLYADTLNRFPQLKPQVVRLDGNCLVDDKTGEHVSNTPQQWLHKFQFLPSGKEDGRYFGIAAPACDVHHVQ